MDRYYEVARTCIVKYGGTWINSTGDGVLATFARPGAAVECGLDLVQAVSAELDLRLRVGIHTGECERLGDDIVGIAVHVASRVCSVAEPHQVVVSRTVRDLVFGAKFAFAAAGTHRLKGVPGTWALYVVTPATKKAPAKRTTRPRNAQPKRGATAKTRGLRVLLVDDHPLWRQTLKAVVEHDDGTKVIAEAADGAEAVAVATARRPDVIVMDMQLPTMSGVESTAAIRDALPEARVLVLSSDQAPDTVLAAVRAGASGYLLKTADAAEIRGAIVRIAGGELVFPAELASVVLAGIRGDGHVESRDPTGAADALSQRERDVLELVADGLSNQAIAKRLFLSLKTVEAHMTSIFAKLGIEPTDDTNRRVRAVVAYLGGQRGSVE
jgi:DNA-binding NarL/FixJ family response regulator